MGLKRLAGFAVLVAVTLAPAAVAADSVNQAGANQPATSLSPPSPPSHGTPHSPANSIRSAASSAQGAASSSRGVASLTQGAASPAKEAGKEDGGRDYPPPQITIANPAPAPSPWSLHERILWAVNLVLVLVAYAGIMLALSLLKKLNARPRTWRPPPRPPPPAPKPHY